MERDWLGRIGIQLILEDPFWGWLYSQLPREVDEQVDGVGLMNGKSATWSIHIHPELEKRVYDPTVLNLVKHELLHFLLEHPIQRKQADEKIYFDLAADLCIDQFIGAYPDKLLWTDFQNMGLLPVQSAQKYYSRFLEILDEGDKEKIGFLKNRLSTRQSFLAKHQLWLEEGEASIQDLEGLFTFLKKDRLNRPEVNWPGNLWNLFLENRGESPSALLNWKDQLHWLVRTSIRTRLVYKKNKLSRRYGFSPGVKIERKHRLLVAVDTSGSVNEEELHLFFKEIHLIFRQGVEMDIVECDAQVQKRYHYTGILPELISGRGDTNYHPPIELLNQEPEFGGLIYFTDGEGPPPFMMPKRPILWVISRSRQHRLDHYKEWPGRKAFLN